MNWLTLLLSSYSLGVIATRCKGRVVVVGSTLGSDDVGDFFPALVHVGLAEPAAEGVVVSPHLRVIKRNQSMWVEDCMAHAPGSCAGLSTGTVRTEW